MAKPMTKAEWVTAMTLWQVPVKYYPGWDTRGRDFVIPSLAFDDINGVVIHHTGSDAGQSDDYLKFLFVTGRPTDNIPGPLCHSAADMDGDLNMGAIGRANHAGQGSSATLGHVVAEDYAGYQNELKPGADNTDGNAHFYGCEVRYDGGQPMTPKQYQAALRWAAAICHHYGWSALSVIGHREWTTRKNDPGSCPMTKFRSDVAALLKAGPPKTTTDTGDDMPYTETQLRAMMQAEIEEYMTRFWVSPTGTGTGIRKQLDAIQAAVNADLAVDQQDLAADEPPTV